MLNSTNLSPHFSVAEACFSDIADRLGIDNSNPSNAVIFSALQTAHHMEHIRSLLGAPIRITSWIRCLKLNRVLESKDTSQHIKGEAVDFTCKNFGSAKEIAIYLLRYKEEINYDQLILEHSWVHIAWNNLPNSIQRKQTLSLLASKSYASGLTDKHGKAL